MFGIYFTDGGELYTPFSDEEKSVICQVFSDLDELINLAIPITTTSGLVKIEIQSYSNPGDGIAGFATPYFENLGESGGLKHDEVWKAINTSYNNPNEWDGMLRMNLGTNYDISYTTLPDDPNSTTNPRDFYMVVLHEAIHLLGFYSLMPNPGVPYQNYYSPFLDQTRVDDEPVIIPGPGPYDFSYNTSMDFPGYTSTCNLTRFKGNGLDVPVFSPSPWDPSAFSHYDISCTTESDPSDNYVMHPAAVYEGNNTNIYSRRITAEEVSTLCALGYQVTGTYGTTTLTEDGSMNPNRVTNFPSCNTLLSATDDYDLHITLGVNIDACGDDFFIPQTALFANDFYTGVNTTNIVGFEEIFIDDNTPSIPYIETNQSGAAGYLLTSPSVGQHTFRYKIEEVDAVGNLLSTSNYAYVTLNVYPCPGLGCTNLSICNLICNPHMENIDNQCFNPSNACFIPFTFCTGPSSGISGWERLWGTPDWIDGTAVSCTFNNDFLEFEDFGVISVINSEFNPINNPEERGEGFRAEVDLEPLGSYLLSYFRTNRRPSSPTAGYDVIISDYASVDWPLTNQIIGTTDPDVNFPVDDIGSFTGDNWTQEVSGFTLDNIDPGKNYDMLYFVAKAGNNVAASGIHFDRVELIEDRMGEIPTSHETECGATQSAGIELCDITNLQYQWWDISSGTAIQISEGGNLVSNFANLNLNYSTASLNANGSVIELGNIMNNVTLELRRRFIIDTDLITDPSITINSDGDSEREIQVEITMPLELPDNTSFTYTGTGCGPFTFTANQAYDYHIWDFGDDAISIVEGLGTDPNAIQPTVTFPSDGTYTVTHTVSNNCGSVAYSEDIVVTGCVDPCQSVQSADYHIGSLSSSAITNFSSLNLGTPVANLTFFVEGEIVMDYGTNNNNLDFNNCTFIMGEGATIRIQDGKWVNIRQSSLYECDRMWKGIELGAVGGLGFWANDIRGAEYALKLKHGSRLRFANNNFNANLVSVFTAPSDNLINIWNYRSSRNNFYGGDLLPPPYANMQDISIANGLPWAGVWLNDVSSINIGLPDNTNQGFVDLYQDLENGIILRDVGTALIQRSQFVNGTNGIIATTEREMMSTLTQIGLENNDPLAEAIGDNPTFIDNDFPITTRGLSDVECYDNEILRSLEGIRVRGSQAFPTSRIKLYDNTIITGNTGIELANNSQSEIDVNTNGIFLTNTMVNDDETLADIGINWLDIQDTEALDMLPREVSNNNILLYDDPPAHTSNIGIFMQGVAGASTSENTIVLDDQERSYGIKMDGGAENQIKCNNVSNTTFGVNDAISVNMTPSSHVECNSTNNTGTGLKIVGVCDNTTIAGNEFNNHTYGLEYTLSASIMPQDNHSNKWLGNYFLAAKWGNAVSSPDPLAVQGSQYLVVPFSGYPYEPPSFFPLNWFAGSDDSVPEIFCNTTDACNTYTSYELEQMSLNEFGSMEENIANGNPVTIEYPDELLWISQKELYKKIEASDPATVSSDLMSFYLSMSEEPLGKLQDIEENKAETFSWDAASIAQARLLMDENKELSEQIVILQLSLDSLGGNDSILVEQEIMNVNTVIQQNIETLNNTYQALRLQREVDATWIGQENGNIMISELYEHNEKRVNEILAGTFDIGSYDLSITQMSEIVFIAEQCPLAGGKSVYKARSIRNSFEPGIFYDDKELCEQVGIAWRKAEDEQNISDEYKDISIQPNPASRQISIISDYDGGIAIFRDVSGKEVQRINLKAGNNLVSVSNWASGLHFVEIMNEQGIRVQISKLVVN